MKKIITLFGCLLCLSAQARITHDAETELKPPTNNEMPQSGPNAQMPQSGPSATYPVTTPSGEAVSILPANNSAEMPSAGPATQYPQSGPKATMPGTPSQIEPSKQQITITPEDSNND